MHGAALALAFGLLFPAGGATADGTTDCVVKKGISGECVGIAANGKLPKGYNTRIRNAVCVAPTSCKKCQKSTLFFGTATGGSVRITVDGVVLDSPTAPGQPAESVTDDLRDLVNADPTLSGAGVTATSDAGVLDIPASTELIISIFDDGINRENNMLPTLAPGGVAALGGMILLGGFALSPRRRETGRRPGREA